MTERDAVIRVLRQNGADDLIPMLGLDQPDAPRIISDDAFRPFRVQNGYGRKAKPRSVIPSYLGGGIR